MAHMLRRCPLLLVLCTVSGLTSLVRPRVQARPRVHSATPVMEIPKFMRFLQDIIVSPAAEVAAAEAAAEAASAEAAAGAAAAEAAEAAMAAEAAATEATAAQEALAAAVDAAALTATEAAASDAAAAAETAAAAAAAAAAAETAAAEPAAPPAAAEPAAAAAEEEGVHGRDPRLAPPWITENEQLLAELAARSSAVPKPSTASRSASVSPIVSRMPARRPRRPCAAPHVHRMCTAYTPHVHRMHTARTPHAHGTYQVSLAQLDQAIGRAEERGRLACVKYYAPWCQSCFTIKPLYERTAGARLGSHPPGPSTSAKPEQDPMSLCTACACALHVHVPRWLGQVGRPRRLTLALP